MDDLEIQNLEIIKIYRQFGQAYRDYFLFLCIEFWNIKSFKY